MWILWGYTENLCTFFSFAVTINYGLKKILREDIKYKLGGKSCPSLQKGEKGEGSFNKGGKILKK